jgi:hypothetical protein
MRAPDIRRQMAVRASVDCLWSQVAGTASRMRDAFGLE